MSLPNTYRGLLAELARRLGEPAPGRVQVLTGPRQVGKTTLLLELENKFASCSVYAAADTPEASLPGWWELQWSRAEQLARTRGLGILLLDEIHHLADWDKLLKAKADELLRRKTPVQTVVTGSSSLLVSGGAVESMMGRFEKLELTHWPASELISVFGLDPRQGIEMVVQRGTYPGALALWADPPRWRSYIRDSIVEPAIGRDILVSRKVRNPVLLRQLFAVCLDQPAEIISLQKLRGNYLDAGSLQTVSQYLKLLESAFLVVPVQKYSHRELRRRSSPPKLIVLNQALLCASVSSSLPAKETDPERWGRWVENACLAHAWNRGQNVFYWREEPLEVDGVFEGSWGNWAVEIKTTRYAVRDLSGLLQFCKAHPDFKPLVVFEEDPGPAERMGVQTMPWREFLLK